MPIIHFLFFLSNYICQFFKALMIILRGKKRKGQNMKKPTRSLLAACLLVNAAAFGEFQYHSAPYFSYLGSDFRCHEEKVILRNGRKICGYVKELSPLEFSFSALPFKRNDLAFILFSEDPALGKVHYISRDGYVFTGNYPKKPFKVMENDGISEYNEIELDASKIQYISFLHREEKAPKIKEKVFNLKLTDGNRLPVILRQDSITITDGYKEDVLPLESVVSLTFNGGLKGYVRKDNGQVEKIPLHFTKDKYLCVEICHTDHLIKFPWNMITALEENKDKFLAGIEFDRYTTLGPGLHVEEEVVKNSLNGAMAAVASTTKNSEALFVPRSEDFQDHEIVFEGLSEFERLQDPLLDSKPQMELDTSVYMNEMISSEIDRISFISSFKSYDFHKDKIAFKTEKILPRQPTESATDEELEEFVEKLGVPPQTWKIMASNSIGALLMAAPPQEQKSTDSFQVPEQEKSIEPKHEGMVFIPPQKISDSEILPGFYIDQRPVTNLQYLQFIKATHYQPPEHWSGDKIPFGLENEPVVNVTFKDAMTYTLWAGKRLPSQNEWQRVVRNAGLEQPPMNEWISTSSAPGQIGGKAHPNSNYRAVRKNGQGIVLPMHKDDFNRYTGFRNVLE